jgi:hypothetical protein
VRETDTIEVSLKDYLPLIWVVVAAVLGISLLCSAAAVGVNDINAAALAGTPTVGVVDFFVSNINTVIAETVVAFSDIVSAPDSTSSPTGTDMSIPVTGGTPTFTPTLALSPFPTFIFPRTSRPPTRTNTPAPTRTYTFTPSSTVTPSNTPTFTPSNTITPSNTPTFTPSNTPIPTNTPPDTDTPVPPTPTDTPVPPDTQVPTNSPVATDTFSAP